MRMARFRLPRQRVEGGRVLRSREAGDFYAAFAGGEFGFVVAGVDVAHDAEGGVALEDALEAAGGFGRAVGDDDLAGVKRVADADAAAVVEGNPRRAVDRVCERVEIDPVGDRVA